MTAPYNRFHDPHESALAIAQLRELHEATDRAVLEVFRYGWGDLAQSARCEFLLDYEEDGDSGFGVGGSEGDETRTPKPKSRRRKPYRLRWPDDFRDEVLARLLELNEQRHNEELLAGHSVDTGTSAGKTKTSRKKRKKPGAGNPSLPGM